VVVLKKTYVIFAVVVCLILLVSVFSYLFLVPDSAPESFYVGVTYCGHSTEEAKLLIDKVKPYTNLFVLQSLLMDDFDTLNEICDYAVSSGLYVIVYFTTFSWTSVTDWLETCKGLWGDRFLGVYYGDELGGRMLEGDTSFWAPSSGYSVMKHSDGSITGVKIAEDVTGTYYADGKIQLYLGSHAAIYYYPNGTTTVQQYDDEPITSTIVEDCKTTYTYETLWSMRPFKTYTEIAERFITHYSNNLVRGPKNQANVTAFTSDYVLYWFDYKAGYDVVLAQLGWNHTIEQDIALVRGAAELQNKPWGTILTWKYRHPPYLDSGEAIYNQMRMSYECGAEYVVVFNYAEDMEGPYGTLQDEHFDALKRFWNKVVKSSAVKHGSIEAEAVLVLPENYGWGMRNPEDTIWGLWGSDEKSQQIWELSRSLLDHYGSGLDIVYIDPDFPVEEKYDLIFYWNQTN
jgi:hypothetical protein